MATPGLRSGAVAGIVAVVVFAVVHDVFISDIWFSLVLMVAAGALCGLCVAWSFGRLFPTPSLKRWFAYNVAYVGLFGLLAVASLVAFEPVATIPELSGMDGRPDELIGQALPLTVAFVAIAAALLSWIFGRGRSDYLPVLVTVGVLTVFLGLNVSIVGLVEFGADEWYLLGVLFGLILVIDAAFAVIYAVLEWRSLMGRRLSDQSSGRP